MLILQGHTSGISMVGFSPDRKRCLTASGDHTARVWDAQTGQELLVLVGHTDQLSGAVFSADGMRILTFGRDHTARVWDARDGREAFSLAGLTDWVRAAAFSPDGARILTGCLSPFDAARVWDAGDGKELLRLPASISSPCAMAFSPEGTRILATNVSAGDAGWYWEQQAGRKIERLPGSAPEDNAAHLWDAGDGRELLSLADNPNYVKNLAIFSPDGSRILTDTGESATMCDAVDGRALFTVSNFNDIEATHFVAATFSPDGTRLLTGNDANQVDVWDAGNGERLLSLCGDSNPDHPGSWYSTACVAFSPDGALILACNGFVTILVWDARDGRKLFTLTGHTDAVDTAAFSPDGRRILTGSRDGTARLCDL